MDIKIPEPVKAIFLGTVIGGISSVLISLTLEPEISETRMGQYGLIIGLISSSVGVTINTITDRNNTQSKPGYAPKKLEAKTDFNPILGDLIRKSAESHLNALLPGSPEYFEALELYGKLLSGDSATLPTNTQETKYLHRSNGE